MKKEWDRNDQKMAKIIKLKRKVADLMKKPTTAAVFTQTDHAKMECSTQTDESVTKPAHSVTVVYDLADEQIKVEAINEEPMNIEAISDEPEAKKQRSSCVDNNQPIKNEAISGKPKSRPNRFARVGYNGANQPIKNEVDVKARFVCPDCKFSTNKKSTFDHHRNVFCSFANPSRDLQCKMCGKWKTLIGLRHHLNSYLT